MSELAIRETIRSGETVTVTTWMGGFGYWLQDTRRHARLTQGQLAEKSKLSLQTIQRYEKGDLPSVKSYLRLMRALGKPVAAINLTHKENT